MVTAFVSALEAVIAILAIGGFGFWILQRRVLPADSLALLATLGLEIALPCQIMAALLTTFDPAAQADWWVWPIAWCAFTAGAGLLARLCAPLFPAGSRREAAMGILYNNAVFFPLVFFSEMFGTSSSHVVNLFLFTIPFSPFYYNTAPLFYRDANGPRRPVRIFTAVMLATLAGLVLRLAGLQDAVPRFALSVFQSVGAMTAPALLLYLGGSIYVDFRDRVRVPARELARFVGVRNVLCPALALLAVHALRLPPALGLMLVIQAAAPPLTSLPAIAERGGGNRGAMNGFMLASFAASVLTVPAFYLLAARLFGPFTTEL